MRAINTVGNSLDNHPGVVAVVVTYHPDLINFRANLRAITRQVDAVLIVDNGSSSLIQSALAALTAVNLHAVLLTENIGLAAAQNRGIDWARSLQARYVVLFDQDSQPNAKMVQCLVTVAESSTLVDGTPALVAPRFVDPYWPDLKPFTGHQDGRLCWLGCADSNSVLEIDAAIASGALISLTSLDVIGGMREDLFVDLVDIEWCFRAREKGYALLGVCDAVLCHRLGDVPKKIMGRQLTMHSPLRSYYFFRNAVWMFQQSYVPRTWKTAVAIQLLKRLIVFSFLIVPRRSYLSYMTRGIWHGLVGRLGRIDKTHPVRVHVPA
ncbi:glycosyltransferase family 2 protein [Thiohalocapsa marina]|uniref:glycosyltransferase family 2 protein n=1 Tax=Thiohalocapsa marina TaxID=424902 RepID=UPI0036DD1AC0